MKKFFILFCSIALLCSSDKKLTPQKPFSKIDLILVEKAKRQMSIYHKGKLLKTYKVALGFEPLRHKEQEGDGKTPEGTYSISGKYPNSQFYKALYVSYPNKNDQKNARKKGVSAGGQIMIHGLGKQFAWLGKSHVNADWTLGCVAVTNEEIKEIYDSTSNGTEVEIRP